MEALDEYKDRLVPPQYIPNRRYLASPICPKCGSNMKLEYKDDGELAYFCIARKCDGELEASIDN